MTAFRLGKDHGMPMYEGVGHVIVFTFAVSKNIDSKVI
jgi:hypothetical protein